MRKNKKYLIYSTFIEDIFQSLAKRYISEFLRKRFGFFFLMKSCNFVNEI